MSAKTQTKSAEETAKDLVASITNDNDNINTDSDENVDIKLPEGFTVIEDTDAEAFLAWKLSQGKLVDLTKEEVSDIKGEEKSGPILMRFYDIVVDSITGHSPKPEEMNVSILTGRVSEADLDLAGVDRAWLLKIGAIVDAGLNYA